MPPPEQSREAHFWAGLTLSYIDRPMYEGHEAAAAAAAEAVGGGGDDVLPDHAHDSPGGGGLAQRRERERSRCAVGRGRRRRHWKMGVHAFNREEEEDLYCSTYSEGGTGLSDNYTLYRKILF